MGYLFIVVGVLVVLLALRPSLEAWRQAEGEAAGRREPPDAAAELRDRLTDLENRVAVVQASMAELAARGGAAGPEGGAPEKAGRAEEKEGEGGVRSAEAPAFAAVLAEAQREAWKQEVYAAYDAGEDVASIARRLGRGKGEIELILNLRRRD